MNRLYEAGEELLSIVDGVVGTWCKKYKCSVSRAQNACDHWGGCNKNCPGFTQFHPDKATIYRDVVSMGYMSAMMEHGLHPNEMAKDSVEYLNTYEKDLRTTQAFDDGRKQFFDDLTRRNTT